MSIKVGKSFKALIAADAALVMAASMAACGPSAGTPSEAKSSDTGTSSSANAKARSLDEIKKSGKIKIAVFSDKAPFGYVDKDGKYQGYDVYFAEQLAKDLGVEPEYTSVDPAARVDVLTSNKVDLVLANFTVTDERKEKVDFAKPYMKVALGVVSPESAQITDVSQLDGKTLIIAKGTGSRRTRRTSSCRSTTSTPMPTTRCWTAVVTPSPPTTPRCSPGPSPTRASRLASPTLVTTTPSRPPCRRATPNC